MGSVRRLLLVFGLALSFFSLVPVTAGDEGSEGGEIGSGAPAVKADLISPILVGSQIPAVEVVSPEGKAMDLSAALGNKPAIIVFYRGSWCPFCNKHLVQIQESFKELAAAGYQVIALAQDSPEENAKVMQKNKLDYPVFADPGLKAARAFGLVFSVDSKTVELYKSYNIDLVGLYGNAQPIMPVPGVFLVDGNGKILFEYVNPDYRVRLPSAILAAAVSAYPPAAGM